MQIDIKGRNVPVTDELRAQLERRLHKVSRQVSELARLEVEIFEERNPSIADRQVAEATLYLKGVTLRARDASREMVHSLKLVSTGARAAGQAPSRQAPAPPRGAYEHGQGRSAPSGLPRDRRAASRLITLLVSGSSRGRELRLCEGV